MLGDWIMAHPWMTFFLTVMLICAVDNAITNICRVLRQGKPEEDKEQEEILESAEKGK